jgi:hypothetical protein
MTLKTRTTTTGRRLLALAKPRRNVSRKRGRQKPLPQGDTTLSTPPHPYGRCYPKHIRHSDAQHAHHTRRSTSPAHPEVTTYAFFAHPTFSGPAKKKSKSSGSGTKKDAKPKPKSGGNQGKTTAKVAGKICLGVEPKAEQDVLDLSDVELCWDDDAAAEVGSADDSEAAEDEEGGESDSEFDVSNLRWGDPISDNDEDEPAPVVSEPKSLKNTGDWAPVDYFLLFFPLAFFSLLAKETNHYAKQQRAESAHAAGTRALFSHTMPPTSPHSGQRTQLGQGQGNGHHALRRHSPLHGPDPASQHYVVLR